MDRLGTREGRVQSLIPTEPAAQQTDTEVDLSEEATRLKWKAEAEEKLRSVRGKT